ncbi:MAG: AI-2E family transporter [Desulfobacteraceae bacterium]|jgi:predicted PurR-regulated permease PerM|nr:AI-2E family transporter [Desulfobacteraceae bacterium]
MNEPGKITGEKTYIGPAIDIAIRIGVIALLIALCFNILRPFISPVVWGIILAIALFPACRRLSSVLSGRVKLAAAIITAVMLLCIILPSVHMVSSLVDGTKYISERLQHSEIKVPPPPDNIDKWPLIGKTLKREWNEASENLKATLTRFQPQLKAMSLWMLKSAMGTALGLVQFALSIVIAGIFMANAKGSGNIARELFVRLAGERGADFAVVSQKTVHNVVKGILGVAIIQALLAGSGFWVAGVPGAGLWAFLCLFLAIIQIGIFPVVIPVIIYMFSSADALTAGLLTAWLILVSLLDNFLKPILMGRGAPVPMLVIFLGAIGGFLSMGFMGLFVGAVILSIGFKLLLVWLDDLSHSNKSSEPDDFAGEKSKAEYID